MGSASSPAHDFARLRQLQKLLGKVLSGVRSGRFGPELTQNAENLYRQYAPFRAVDELGFARSHSLYAEILDQNGEYHTSRKLLQSLSEEFRDQFKGLTKQNVHLPGIPNKERMAALRLARQKVMCCLAYGFAAYRMRDYTEAKDVFVECADFLNHKLIDKEGDTPFLCNGTSARLQYFYGQLFRAQRDFANAREAFVKALECAHARITFRRRQMEERSRPERLASDQLFANHCAGKVLGFGLGWTYLLQGELSKAAEQLQAARVLLAGSHDEFLKWQVELLSCSVLRSQKGTSAAVAELIPRIEDCYDKLAAHSEYGLQALRELVKAHLAVAQSMSLDRAGSAAHWRKARKLVHDCQRVGRDSKTNQIYCLVLTSRIARAEAGNKWNQESYTKAHQAYTDAKALAGPDARGLGAALLEAAIALGEAMSNSKESEQRIEAKKYFNEAIRNGGDNPLVRCASHLHLAEISLSLDEIADANAYLEAWRKKSFNVEHRWLHEKAEILEAKLANDKVFVVGPNDARKYKELTADFHRFLLNRARDRQAGQDFFNIGTAAKHLGVDRKTITKWVLQSGAKACPKCKRKRFFCSRHSRD